jgi:hypothetical protein
MYWHGPTIGEHAADPKWRDEKSVTTITVAIISSGFYLPPQLERGDYARASTSKTATACLRVVLEVNN